MGEPLDPLAATQWPYPHFTQNTGPTGTLTCEGPTINGIPMPGQWLLKSAPKFFGWQEQAATFMNGAYLVPKGDPLVLVEYDVRIWSSADAVVYRALLGTLLKKPVIVVPGVGGSSAALGIHDPSLKDVGVTSVVVWSVTPLYNPLVTSGGKGPWTASVAFKQYRPLTPAPPVPDQTIPDPGAVTPAAANNLAAANASVTAGSNKLQATTATALLNH
jgi:hypothetical protein